MKTSIPRVLIPLLVLGLGSGAVSAQAGTLDVNWIGPTGMGGGGNWSTAADWSGGVVPNNGGGNTYDVTLPTYSSGVYAVSLDTSPAIDGLTVASNAGLFWNPPYTLIVGSLTNAGSMAIPNLTVLGTVTNSGLLEGTATVGGNLNNSGNLLGGSISVAGTLSNSGGVVTDEGTFTAAHYVQTGTSASTIIDGGTMTVTDATVSGGEFLLNACCTTGNTLNGDFTINGGTFAVGSRIPVLTGNLTIADTGTYLEPLSRFSYAQGLLAVLGDASLDGTLDVDFSGPVQPGVYQMMTYFAETGAFSRVDVEGSSQKVSLEYGLTALDLVVTGPPVPEPASLLLLGTGILALALRFRHKQAS